MTGAPGLLVIFGGLPGVGKSTLARALAARAGAVYLRIDSLEDALRASALAPVDVMDAGYRAAQAAARDNLSLGLDVVADSVNPIELSREAWRGAAKQARAPFLEVEIICSDSAEHRRRVESRLEATGVGPDWSAVCARRYAPWREATLRLDTAETSGEAALDLLMQAIARRRRKRGPN